LGGHAFAGVTQTANIKTENKIGIVKTSKLFKNLNFCVLILGKFCDLLEYVTALPNTGSRA